LSALKRLVLMRKKKPAWKPLEPIYDSFGRTTPRPWELSTQPTSSSAYRSSPSVTSRASPGRPISQSHLHLCPTNSLKHIERHHRPETATNLPVPNRAHDRALLHNALLHKVLLQQLAIL
jgi:hypothetical protein